MCALVFKRSRTPPYDTPFYSHRRGLVHTRSGPNENKSYPPAGRGEGRGIYNSSECLLDNTPCGQRWGPYIQRARELASRWNTVQSSELYVLPKDPPPISRVYGEFCQTKPLLQLGSFLKMCPVLVEECTQQKKTRRKSAPIDSPRIARENNSQHSDRGEVYC